MATYRVAGNNVFNEAAVSRGMLGKTMALSAVLQCSDERSPRLVKLPELMARMALSRSEVYRRVRHDPDFPKPTLLGLRSVAWVESEIDDYLRARIASRDAKGGAK